MGEKRRPRRRARGRGSDRPVSQGEATTKHTATPTSAFNFQGDRLETVANFDLPTPPPRPATIGRPSPSVGSVSPRQRSSVVRPEVVSRKVVGEEFAPPSEATAHAPSDTRDDETLKSGLRFLPAPSGLSPLPSLSPPRTSLVPTTLTLTHPQPPPSPSSEAPSSHPAPCLLRRGAPPTPPPSLVPTWAALPGRPGRNPHSRWASAYPNSAE